MNAKKVWIKDAIGPKLSDFWSTEVSSSEICLRENDFRDAVCYIPEEVFIKRESELLNEIDELEQLVKELNECCEFYVENREEYLINIPEEHKKHGFELFVDMGTVSYLSGNIARQTLERNKEILERIL